MADEGPTAPLLARRPSYGLACASPSHRSPVLEPYRMSHSISIRRLLPVLAIGLLALLAAGPGLAKEESKIKAAFENTGAEPDAKGSLRLKLDDEEASLDVKLDKLSSDTGYRMLADGVEKASFETNGSGKAKLEFIYPHEDGDDERELDFDPRTKEITVQDGDTVVLRVDLQDLDSPKQNLKDRTELDPEPDVDGDAEARFDVRPNGREELRIKLKGVEEGSYRIVVADEDRGSIETNSGGGGKFSFLKKQNGKPVNEKAGKNGKGHNKRSSLDFDPYTALIEIFHDPDGEESSLAFSGYMLAQLPGLTVCDPDTGDLGLDLAQEGGGSLMASFDLDERCEREFSVVLDGLGLDTNGEYDLYVGENGPYPIQVGAGSGEIVFSTEPEEGEEPLTFDPRSKTIELVDGDEVTVFEGDFPAS
jgi:hypothetical protein